jgi:hypothetical protein
MLKMPLQTHCNNFLVNVSSHHISFHHSSESFTLYFYNFCKFPSLIEIGLLMYLMNPRPYICFAVNTLSQYMVEPGGVHLITKKK